MKKKSKKLTLNRETLVRLEDPNLQFAAGGISLRCPTYQTCTSCSPDTCPTNPNDCR